MKIHHLILIIVLVFFLLKNNNILEGNTNILDNVSSLIRGSSLLREEIDVLKRKLINTLEIDVNDIDDVLKKEILYSEFVASMENENNDKIVDCISDNCNYKEDIQKMLLDFAERYDQFKIEENSNLKEIIDTKKKEDFKYYQNKTGEPLRYEQISKRYLDKKYKKCIDDYNELQSTQNCDTEIEKVKKEEEKKCDESSKKLQDNLSDYRTKVKDLNALKKRINKLNKQLNKEKNKIKKINKRWNDKPDGVLFTNKFPLKEINHRNLKCIKNLRISKKNHNACNEICKKTPGCRHVWHYKHYDRCCFKSRFIKNRRFRRGRGIVGWYTKI